jgi:hypothetical protein
MHRTTRPGQCLERQHQLHTTGEQKEERKQPLDKNAPLRVPTSTRTLLIPSSFLRCAPLVAVPVLSLLRQCTRYRTGLARGAI